MTKQERWSRVCDLLFKLHKEEILRDGDWWYGTDHYDINIYGWGEDANMEAVVYDMTGEYFQYSHEQVVFAKNIYVGARV